MLIVKKIGDCLGRNLKDIFVGSGLLANAVGIIFRHENPIINSGIKVFGWIFGVAGNVVNLYDLSKQIEDYEKKIRTISKDVYHGWIESATWRSWSRKLTVGVGQAVNAGVILLYGVHMFLLYREAMSKKDDIVEDRWDLGLGIFGIVVFFVTYLLTTRHLRFLLQEAQAVHGALKRARGIERFNEEFSQSSTHAIMARLDEGVGVGGRPSENIPREMLEPVLLATLRNSVNPDNGALSGSLADMLYVDDMTTFFRGREKVRALEKITDEKRRSSQESGIIPVSQSKHQDYESVEERAHLIPPKEGKNERKIKFCYLCGRRQSTTALAVGE